LSEEKREVEKREVEKREVEKREVEKREVEKREVEKREVEKREVEKRGGVRKLLKTVITRIYLHFFKYGKFASFFRINQ
jgi:small subunit ribosomal protein S11